MKVKLFLGLAVILLCTFAASAQEADKFEITGDYSYFRFNPGLPSYFNSQNLNGGGGQGALYLNSWFGIAADLQGYGSYTQCLKPGNPLGATGCASGNLFTYTFGPQIKYRAGRFEPFAEVLLAERIPISMPMLVAAKAFVDPHLQAITHSPWRSAVVWISKQLSASLFVLSMPTMS